MKRAVSLATVAAAGVALAVSALAAPTAATPTETADNPSPTPAKGPSSWTKISTGNVSLINEPTLYRTGNGVLHVAYTQGAGLRWSNVSKHGRLLGRGTILAGWDHVAKEPKLIPAPDNRLRVVFGGIDTDGGSAYDDNRLYAANASSSGTSWSLAPAALTSATFNPSGIAAVPGPPATGLATAGVVDQRPIVAAAVGEPIYWRQADGSSAPTGPDNVVSNGDCCAYNSALARDAKDGRVYLGWFSGGGSNHPGVFVKRLPPSGGPTVKAPASSQLQYDQTVALSGRRDAAGVYAAYCSGYPTCEQLKLWRVGAQRAITVPRSKDASYVALAAAPKGRLWVAWVNDTTNQVRATLTNRKATRFGPVRAVKTPQQFSYRLAAYSGAVRQLDVVVNTDGELFHRQLLPGLKLTAKPRRFDNDRRRVVTFTVTDAGAPVAGARIRVAGKTDTTGAKGKATIAFGKGFRPGRYHATAAKPAYAKGHVTIRVRQ